MLGRKRGRGGAQPVYPVGRERLLDQRRDALGVDARRRPGRSPCRPRSACSPACPGRPSAVGSRRGDLRHAFGAQVEHQQQVALRGGHFSRHAQALSRGWRGSAPAMRSWSTCTSTFSADLPAASVSVANSGLGYLFVGFRRELADVAVVVLQRLLLLAFQAAVDEQHDHDQQHDADAGGHAAAHHQGVLVEPTAGPLRRRGRRGRGRAAAGGARGARADGRGAVSSPSSKNDKSYRSFAGTSGRAQYDCRRPPAGTTPATSRSVRAFLARPCREAGPTGGERRTRWSRCTPSS